MSKIFKLALVIITMGLSSGAKAESKVAIANNNLGIALYNKLAIQSPETNIFISPYSIYSALGIAYAGSNGKTKDEFEKVMGIKNPADFNEELSASIKSLNDRDGNGFSISTANALWVDVHSGILSSYQDLTKKYYDTSDNTIDKTRPEESAKKVNDWVAKKTRDKIKDLVNADIMKASVMVITNAVYFKGEWASPFKTEATIENDFSLFSGKKIKAQMMQQVNSFNSLFINGKNFLELPYKGGDLSMILVLPAKGYKALKQAEKNLNNDLTKFMATDVELRHQVKLVMPKFKIESPLLLLNEPLKKLGINDAFYYPQADFSGINGNKDLFISKVLHKAMIEVNEAGTEAAAASVITMEKGGLSAPSKVQEFIADRPFLYVIRDNKTGLVLFIGKMINPTY